MYDIASFLNKRPANYARANYDLFLAEAKVPSFANSIHIAGTNGKGSVATYLFEMYKDAGYKVGLFVSPHYKDYKELARVNHNFISDDFITDTVHRYYNLISKYHLSFFEIMTFVTFKFFESQNVDIAIIETGLGGLIDATNIFTPSVSVITNVHADHLVEIGPDITSIARHKAGIIKENTPLIHNVHGVEALQIINETAKLKNSEIIEVRQPSTPIVINHKQVSFVWDGEKYELNSGALYEVTNAAIVLEVVKYMNKHSNLRLSDANIRTGLNTKSIIGRYTIVSETPLIIVDGAHNMHGIRAFVASVKQLKVKKVKFIYAAFVDKQIYRILDYFKKEELDVTLTTFPHERAAKDFVTTDYKFVKNYKETIKNAKRIPKDEAVVFCGSLYFANLVVEEFKK